jgi:signal transduction histidine kinase
VQYDLRLSKVAAENANQFKSYFIANMSHEIRTPIHGIMGLTKLLQDNSLNEKQERYTKMILNSSEGLLAIINDILDIAKIESGKMELDCIPIDLRSVCETAMDTVYVKALEKNLNLTLNYPTTMTSLVIGDATRIRQILVNLIGNGIKFTSAGSITIDVSTTPIAGNTTEATITVTDTSIGIPQDKMELIFEKFSQESAKTATEFGGTGLGLSICNELAALMGGKISIQSTLGVGSRFSVTLTLEAQQVVISL